MAEIELANTIYFEIPGNLDTILLSLNFLIRNIKDYTKKLKKIKFCFWYIPIGGKGIKIHFIKGCSKWTPNLKILLRPCQLSYIKNYNFAIKLLIQSNYSSEYRSTFAKTMKGERAPPAWISDFEKVTIE